MDEVRRVGRARQGARFVDDFGMGPAERGLVDPDYADMGLERAEAVELLADVVALAELLLERLAEVTDRHERQILGDIGQLHDE